jgi:ATP-binding cassette subfamily B protein
MNSRLDEVKEASKADDAHDFIRKLPMQYYTFLVEAGEGLSGGEKHGYVL